MLVVSKTTASMTRLQGVPLRWDDQQGALANLPSGAVRAQQHAPADHDDGRLAGAVMLVRGDPFEIATTVWHRTCSCPSKTVQELRPLEASCARSRCSRPSASKDSFIWVFAFRRVAPLRGCGCSRSRTTGRGARPRRTVARRPADAGRTAGSGRGRSRPIRRGVSILTSAVNSLRPTRSSPMTHRGLPRVPGPGPGHLLTVRVAETGSGRSPHRAGRSPGGQRSAARSPFAQNGRGRRSSRPSAGAWSAGA